MDSRPDDNPAGVPQSRGTLFLTDGGLETTLVVERGVQLPQSAAFPLLADESGRQLLTDYYKPYLTLAARTPGAGFILETPTRRASSAWGERLGYDDAALAAINRQAGEFCHQLRRTWASRIEGDVVVAGVIGPVGALEGDHADDHDGGHLGQRDSDMAAGALAADEAAGDHRPQAEALREGGVDMLIGVSLTSSAEAIGIARAAAAVGLPVALSFALGSDGRLPGGEGLGEAIERVDAVASAAYFGVDSAQPRHVEAALTGAGAWRSRIRAVRAQGSTPAHAERDASRAADAGDPEDLARQVLRLRDLLPALNVLGGCASTGEAHVKAIARAWTR